MKKIYSVPALSKDGREYSLLVLMTQQQAEEMERVGSVNAFVGEAMEVIAMQEVADEVIAGLERNWHLEAGGTMQ